MRKTGAVLFGAFVIALIAAAIVVGIVAYKFPRQPHHAECPNGYTSSASQCIPLPGSLNGSGK